MRLTRNMELSIRWHSCSLHWRTAHCSVHLKPAVRDESAFGLFQQKAEGVPFNVDPFIEYGPVESYTWALGPIWLRMLAQ